MSKTRNAPSRLDQKHVHASLQRLMDRIDNLPNAIPRTDGPRHLVFELRGRGGGTWVLRFESHGKKASIHQDPGMLAGSRPLLEIRAPAATVFNVLENRLDARDAFLEGETRVRGDIRVLEDLAGRLSLFRARRSA